MRATGTAAALVAALAGALLLVQPGGVLARRVLATVPYSLSGGAPTVVGKLEPGGQILVDWTISEKGAPTGRAYGACAIVAVAPGGAARALCQLHFEWDGGASVMYVQGTLTHSAGGPLSGRLAVLGGIGRWQGAHGEDGDFSYDGKAGGGGKIVLNCLDGVC
ncbi:hypothetical protein Rsub_03298 [Raphidocelis subcapitata]|uniref:Dirigent protein n=1 Tax=Raphidocelis subcapitata TaxID=307507 RepID=A0A2V0NZC3_9CHLO|nr:hypothetical protein Rsub_03298 [Raphidocelis subcapitata]|eukprot:GBF90165.1 hypothetical protein Rsub_03298 [Raphidocelis subcapitata]